MRNEMKVREWLLHAKSCFDEAFNLLLSPRRTRFGMQIAYVCGLASEMVLKSALTGFDIPFENEHSMMLLIYDIDRKMKQTDPSWNKGDALSKVSFRLFGQSGKYRYPDMYNPVSQWKRIAEQANIRQTVIDMISVIDYAEDVFERGLNANISRLFRKRDLTNTLTDGDSTILTSKCIDGLSEDLSCWVTYSRGFADAANNMIRQLNKSGSIGNESGRLLCHFCHQSTELMLKSVLRFHGIECNGHNLQDLILKIEETSGVPSVPSELKAARPVLQRYDGDGKYPISGSSMPTPKVSDQDTLRCAKGMAKAYEFGRDTFGRYAIELNESLGAFMPQLPKFRGCMER